MPSNIFSFYRAIGLAILCVVLFAASFPPASVSVAAFLCVAPLFWLTISIKRLLNAFLVGLLIGLIIENLKFYWIYNVSGFGFKEGLVVGLYLASYYAIWSVLANWSYRRLGASKLLIFGLSSAWVCLEWLLSNLSFLSFGWATLAHTQANNLLVLQIAEIFGAYGVSFFVVLINLLVATFSHNNRRNTLILASVATFVLSWGVTALLFQDQSKEILRVASIQPSFTRAKALSEQDPERRLNRLITLSDRVLEYSPELLLWPEAAVRGGAISAEDRYVGKVISYSRLTSTPILFGFSSVEKASSIETGVEQPKIAAKRFNNVLFADSPINKVQRYAKRKLMPFGEYQPIPIRNALFDAFLPEVVDIERGQENIVINVNGSAKISPIICWEVLFDDFVRKAVVSDVNLIALFNNDNWFDKSPAGEQHNRSAILRAVENGRPIIVSSNTGPTIVVDKNGRILASSNSIYDQKHVVADVPLVAKQTLYRSFGFHFIFFCGFLSVVLILRSFLLRPLIGR